MSEEDLDLGASETQIVPLLVGDASRAMELCERLLERGVFAQAIRPPTVPEGSSRLRLTVMATHRAAELRRAGKLIAAAAKEVGATGRWLSLSSEPGQQDPMAGYRQAA